MGERIRHNEFCLDSLNSLVTALKSIGCASAVTFTKHTALQTAFLETWGAQTFLLKWSSQGWEQSSRKTLSLVAKGRSHVEKAQGSTRIFNRPAALQPWLGDSASCLTTMGRRIPAVEEALCVASSLLHKRGA